MTSPSSTSLEFWVPFFASVVCSVLPTRRGRCVGCCVGCCARVPSIKTHAAINRTIGMDKRRRRCGNPDIAVERESLVAGILPQRIASDKEAQKAQKDV